MSKDCSERLRIVAESTWKNFLFLLGRLQTKERKPIFSWKHIISLDPSREKNCLSVVSKGSFYFLRILPWDGGDGENSYIFFFQFINEYIQERKGTQNEKTWPL